MTNSIYHFLIKYHGHWDHVYDAINKREQINNIKHSCLNEDNIFIVNDNYPEKLKTILLPPFFVFYKGDMSLINKNVLTIIGKIGINDLVSIIHNSKNSVLCFNNNDINDSIYQTLVAANKEFIVVCEGGIDVFKFEHKKNILLISEYNNSNDYQKAEDQTIERLLFAFANKLYFAKFDYDTYKKIEINLSQIKKPLYTNIYYQKMIEDKNINKSSITFVKNISSIL